MIQGLGEGDCVDTKVVPQQQVRVSCNTPTTRSNEMLAQVYFAGTSDDRCPSRTEGSGTAGEDICGGSMVVKNAEQQVQFS